LIVKLLSIPVSERLLSPSEPDPNAPRFNTIPNF